MKVKNMIVKNIPTWRLPLTSIIFMKTLASSMALVMATTFGTSAKANQSDAQINALISQAVASHPLVGAAVADKMAAAEGITAAKLNLLPTPSISAGYDANNDLVTQAVIRQPLWTGGRLTAAVNQAIMDDKAAQESVYIRQNEVAKNTIDAWKSYVTAAALQKLHLENIDNMTGFEEMMKRRVAQGVSASIELDLVRNRILLEQNAYHASKEQRRIAAARLQQIIGKPIAENALVIDNLAQAVQQVKGKSATFEQMAFDNISYYNPNVVKAAYEIAAAQEEYVAQKANNYPSVYAQYQYSYDHGDHQDNSSLRLAMNYEPGAGFSNLALNRASRSRIDSLVKSQEAARRTVIENIQNQYQQFVSSQDKERLLIATVEGAKLVVASNERLFKAGRKDWTEVLNSIRELNSNRQELVQIRTNILATFYQLQVEFGLMPWQQFQQNRLPTPAFSPLDEAKSLLERSTDNQQPKPYDLPKLVPQSTIQQLDNKQTDSQQANKPSVKKPLNTLSKSLKNNPQTTFNLPTIQPSTAQSNDHLHKDDVLDSDDKLNQTWLKTGKITPLPLDNSDVPVNDVSINLANHAKNDVTRAVKEKDVQVSEAMNIIIPKSSKKQQGMSTEETMRWLTTPRK